MRLSLLKMYLLMQIWGINFSVKNVLMLKTKFLHAYLKNDKFCSGCKSIKDKKNFINN